MKKFIFSLIIFVFVSLSFSFISFAEYDTRQLPWVLPPRPEGYEHSHKYIMIYEDVSGSSRNVYLLYSHLPFSCVRRTTTYISYRYEQPETLKYELVDGIFVYKGVGSARTYFEGKYKDYDIDNFVYLEYNEWLPNRDIILSGRFPIASNVNITFDSEEWDKNDGLYDLPPPDAPPDDDDDHSGLIGGIVGGILNGLKSLFIPERNIFADIVAKFGDKFPIVGQISNLIASLYNIGDNEPVFLFTYKGIELKVIDFTAFSDYMPLIKNFTGAFLFLSFLVREIKILPGIIRGRQ